MSQLKVDTVTDELGTGAPNFPNGLTGVELTPAQVTDPDDETSGTVSGQRLAAAFDAQEQQVGVGQTWQDVSGSRADGTVYQNTTGRPIVWIARMNSTGSGGMELSPDNDTFLVCHLRPVISSGSVAVSHSVIVPPGWYYRMTNNAQTWLELR